MLDCLQCSNCRGKSWPSAGAQEIHPRVRALKTSSKPACARLPLLETCVRARLPLLETCVRARLALPVFSAREAICLRYMLTN